MHEYLNKDVIMAQFSEDTVEQKLRLKNYCFYN